MLVSRGKALYNLYPNNLAIPLSQAPPEILQNIIQDDTNDKDTPAQLKSNLNIEVKAKTCFTDQNTLAKPIHIYQILQEISKHYSLDIFLTDLTHINGLKIQESPLTFDKIGTHTISANLYDQHVDITVTVAKD